MLTTLFLTALFAAGPQVKPNTKPAVEYTKTLPDNFRVYFERADATHAAKVATTEARIADNEVRYRGAAPALKGDLRRSINSEKKSLEATKKETPAADMPADPDVDALGQLRSVQILAVLDEHRVVGQVLAYSQEKKKNLHTEALLYLESTKGVRVTANRVENYHPHDVWRVLDEKMEDQPDAMRWTSKRVTFSTPLLVLKAVPADELNAMRKLYAAKKLAEQAAKKPVVPEVKAE